MVLNTKWIRNSQGNKHTETRISEIFVFQDVIESMGAKFCLFDSTYATEAVWQVSSRGLRALNKKN